MVVKDKSEKFNIEIELKNVFINSTSKIDKLLKYLKYIDITNRTLTFTIKYIKQISNYHAVIDVLKYINTEVSEFYNKSDLENKKVKTSRLKQLYCKAWYAVLKICSDKKLKRDSILYLCLEGIDKINDACLLQSIIFNAFKNDIKASYFCTKGIIKLMLFSKSEGKGVYERLIELINQQMLESEYCSSFLDDLDIFLMNEFINPKHAELIAQKLDGVVAFARGIHKLAISNIIINLLKRRPCLRYLYDYNARVDDQFKPEDQLVGMMELEKERDRKLSELIGKLKHPLDNQIDTIKPSESVNLSKDRIEKCRRKATSIMDGIQTSDVHLTQSNGLEENDLELPF